MSIQKIIKEFLAENPGITDLNVIRKDFYSEDFPDHIGSRVLDVSAKYINSKKEFFVYVGDTENFEQVVKESLPRLLRDEFKS